MPANLQTRDIVFKALDKCLSNLPYVRPELISLEQAQEMFRDSEYTHEHIPEHFYSEFTGQTGLPKEFFGGEVSFQSLRMNKGNFRYCKLGDCYLGCHKYDRYSSPMYLIMTRRTPHSIRPEVVFDRTIGTYHTTWLEKLIADYDPCFSKPAIPKGLKEYQVNAYYGIEKVDTYKGLTIYRNTLFSTGINYAVKIDGIIRNFNEIDDLKETIDETEQKAINPQSRHTDLQRIAV